MQEERRSTSRVEYRLERRETAPDLSSRFTPSQRELLEKLNRADAAHLVQLQWLIVPTEWRGELDYSPFPMVYEATRQVPKFLIVDQPSQAFAAYEYGQLIRWGPVSSGGRTSPTASGLFYLNWRSRGRYSTDNPSWFMKWYFNFENRTGLSFHSFALPGYPASHGCIRLLERDARWIHEWGDGWTLDAAGQVATPGTPILVVGQYAFANPQPWRSLEFLARTIELPERPLD